MGHNKSVHFSIHHMYGTIQDKMTRFSPECLEQSLD